MLDASTTSLATTDRRTSGLARRERVRDACDRGYLVTLVSDACTTESAERHEQSLLGIRGYAASAPRTCSWRRLRG